MLQLSAEGLAETIEVDAGRPREIDGAQQAELCVVPGTEEREVPGGGGAWVLTDEANLAERLQRAPVLLERDLGPDSRNIAAGVPIVSGVAWIPPLR